MNSGNTSGSRGREFFLRLPLPQTPNYTNRLQQPTELLRQGGSTPKRRVSGNAPTGNKLRPLLTRDGPNEQRGRRKYSTAFIFIFWEESDKKQPTPRPPSSSAHVVRRGLAGFLQNTQSRDSPLNVFTCQLETPYLIS